MSNTITVNGRLAKDGELKYGQSGKAMLRLSVPDQKRRFNQQTNEWENASGTTWFGITVFEKTAEDLAEHAIKGAPISVTGRLITREYTTQTGEQRQSLEIDQAQVVIGVAAQRQGGNGARNYDAAQSTPSNGGFGQSDPWATGGQPQQQGFGGSAETAPF